MNDKKLIEASYITALYQNVGVLTGQYTEYFNISLEIQSKYGIDENTLKNISDDERKSLTESIQRLRMIAMQTYIQYESIRKHTNFNEDSQIQENYKKICTKFFTDPQFIELFVLSLNKFLINDIMQELFDKSQEILNRYGTNNNVTQSTDNTTKS